jgi:hypothetical protein
MKQTRSMVLSMRLPVESGRRLKSIANRPSGVTSKAANGGHFKTGQRNVAWD